MFVDGVVLHEVLVLLDDLADKGFHRLKEALAGHSHVMQASIQKLLDSLLQTFVQT